MDKFLFPQHPTRVNNTGASNCANNFFIINSLSNFINDFEKIYIYSSSLHQDLYQKMIKSFSNYIPININPNILNKVDIYFFIHEIGKEKQFEKSDTEKKHMRA